MECRDTPSPPDWDEDIMVDDHYADAPPEPDDNCDWMVIQIEHRDRAGRRTSELERGENLCSEDGRNEDMMRKEVSGRDGRVIDGCGDDGRGVNKRREIRQGHRGTGKFR